MAIFQNIREGKHMPFCSECGAQMSADATICPSCGAVNENVASKSKPSGATRSSSSVSAAASSVAGAAFGAAASAKNAAENFKNASEEAYQRTVSQRNQSRNVVLSDGEQIVKSYCCAKMVHPKCDGYLTVTNKRILFEGRGGASRVTQEAWIEGVSGINAFYGWDIQVLRLILGIIAVIAGFVVFRSSKPAAIALLVIGGLLIYSALLKCFKMEIHTGNFTASGISLGSSPTSALGNGALYTLTGRPTEDTDCMMNELGAMVKDLQTMGDLAIQKWQ
jgi:hypothetical protein